MALLGTIKCIRGGAAGAQLPSHVLKIICDFIPDMYALCPHWYVTYLICNGGRCYHCGATYHVRNVVPPDQADMGVFLPYPCLCVTTPRRSRRLRFVTPVANGFARPAFL